MKRNVVNQPATRNRYTSKPIRRHGQEQFLGRRIDPTDQRACLLFC